MQLETEAEVAGHRSQPSSFQGGLRFDVVPAVVPKAGAVEAAAAEPAAGALGVAAERVVAV